MGDKHFLILSLNTTLETKPTLAIVIMEQEDVLLRINLERPLYEQETLNQSYDYETPQLVDLKPMPMIQNGISKIKAMDWRSYLLSSVPIIEWLHDYHWKEHIMHDIISGLTVAIMHISQGVAYAFLGNVPPIVGIYMAFFPVLIYAFFGTSKHISIGTFAVLCLMTGQIVESYSTFEGGRMFMNGSETVFHKKPENIVYMYTPIQVAVAVSLMVGIYQVIMYIFRLGIMTSLLNEALVNSFTTACCVYVLISQIKNLLGLKLPKERQYFRLIYTIINLFKEIRNTNIADMIISFTTIIIILCNNRLLKPKMSKITNIPMPIELIMIIGGTLISRYCNLSSKYNIDIVRHVPTGLPKPEAPLVQLLPLVAVDSISITIVSYATTMSMALIFAQKLNYEIDWNQELLAMGLSNIMGSFFSCMPISASLSRSLIQQTVGGRSQIASFVSCLLLLIVLLWIAPFFESLPISILASIIIIALTGMMQQATKLVKFWKLNKVDALIWIVTFVLVLLINIDVGLYAGIFVSLITVLLQAVIPYMYLLGHIPNTDLYLDCARYKAAVEIKGIKIFRYCGILNFVNIHQFKSNVYELVGLSQEIVNNRKSINEENHFLNNENSEDRHELCCIIMDMSALNYIDPSGVQVLHTIVKECAEMNIEFYFVNCPSPVFDMIFKCDIHEYGALSLKIFVTIQDAVTYCENNSEIPINSR